PAKPKRPDPEPIAPPAASLFAEPEDVPAEAANEVEIEPDWSRGPAPEPARPSFEAAPEQEEEPWPPSPPPDLPAGPGQPEDVDAILAMLRAQGLFEPPTGEPAQWAKRAEVKAAKKTQGSGTRIGIWLGAVWVLAIGAAV